MFSTESSSVPARVHSERETLRWATQGLLRRLVARDPPVLLSARCAWPNRLRAAPPRPSVWPQERHAFFEVAHVGGGECALVIDGVPYRMYPGDIALVPPGLMHYETPVARGVGYRLYWITVDAPFAALFASAATTRIGSTGKIPSYEVRCKSCCSTSVIQSSASPRSHVT